VYGDEILNDRLRKVVVLGGGSAGWLVAGLLASEHPELHITVVESSEVPIIGVGEGTWPSMRDTLRRIGLSESAFVRDCDVAFKQGSRFDGWMRGAPGAQGDRYYHPFMLPVGHGETDLVQAFGSSLRSRSCTQADADTGVRRRRQLRLPFRRRAVRQDAARARVQQPGRPPRGRPCR
jgi:glycine/D-amino acid oxidase-like deaminating enzyme